MDEPTSAITSREAGKLFESIDGLKAKGVVKKWKRHKKGWWRYTSPS